MNNGMSHEVRKYIEKSAENTNKAFRDGTINKTFLLGNIHSDLLLLNTTMAFIADKLADLVELQMKEKEEENKDD